MALLTGMSAAHKNIAAKVVKSIKKDAPVIIKSQLEGSLNKGADSLGDGFPEKKESTKRAYALRGWNQTKWLVRTGDGKKVITKKTSLGIKLTPQGEDYMKHVKQSDTWFRLSTKSITNIINKIKKRLK